MKPATRTLLPPGTVTLPECQHLSAPQRRSQQDSATRRAVLNDMRQERQRARREQWVKANESVAGLRELKARVKRLRKRIKAGRIGRTGIHPKSDAQIAAQKWLDGAGS